MPENSKKSPRVQARQKRAITICRRANQARPIAVLARPARLTLTPVRRPLIRIEAFAMHTRPTVTVERMPGQIGRGESEKVARERNSHKQPHFSSA